MTDLGPVLTVSRWRRYGKDRVYVAMADGSAKVGWWDLARDEPHPETPEQLAVLTAAVDAWRTGDPRVDEAPDPAAPPTTAASRLVGLLRHTRCRLAHAVAGSALRRRR